jgi:tRNA1Val (adenine37-N6)-methyltransferase
MPHAKPFHFKQFSIYQDKCAMKIGTDGVLLGAWTTIMPNTRTILDIGAGTGIIALQMAQRATAETIDAIEIEENAYEQCVENFEASPWGDRLFCYQASLEEFASEVDEKYDLIVSNPPFYADGYKSNNASRDTARFADALPFRHLADCVAALLSDKGVFSVILPKKEEENFIHLASEVNLFPQRFCHIKGNATSEVKRVMMEFSFEKKEIQNENIVIEISRHNYTQAYTNLVKDFYLKM